MNEPSDDIQALEEAIKLAEEGVYVLKLYVSGSSAKSAKAITNIRGICDEHLAGRFQLEVIDVYQQPELAYEGQLLAAPTLVKESPAPIRKVVGDMSNEERILYSLNIQRKTP